MTSGFGPINPGFGGRTGPPEPVDLGRRAGVGLGVDAMGGGVSGSIGTKGLVERLPGMFGVIGAAAAAVAAAGGVAN